MPTQVLQGLSKRVAKLSLMEAAVDPQKPVTNMEYRLIQAIADGNSVRSAAIRAGYKDSKNLEQTVYEVLRKPNVAIAIQQAREKITAAKQFTREKAFDMLQEAFDMGKLMAEPMAMVGATREMIKMAGYNAPVKVDLNVSGSVQIEKLNQLTDAQLLEIMNSPTSAAALQHAVVTSPENPLPMLDHTSAPSEPDPGEEEGE